MNSLNIIIVEDETIVALDLKHSIEALGHKVLDIASNAQEAISLTQKYSPQLLFMDINLNDSITGIECYQIIRKNQSVDVVYLTAYTDDETINKAINTNPLAYLIKPFSDDELKAVLKLISYKLQNNSTEITKDKNITILSEGYYYDNVQEKLFFKEHPIRLSKNETSLLKLLLEAKGNAISYSDIEYNIWPDNVINSETLRALVYRLRSKIEYNLIETIPSFGYKLIF